MGKKRKDDVIREGQMTYEDYANLPYEEGHHYELTHGHLELMSPGASFNHQVISGEVFKRLVQSCEQDYFILHAPLDVILSETEVKQPDLIMIHRERLHIVTKRGIEGAPDLVVEILSPTSFERDKVSKLRSYAHFQIPEYWIIDPTNETLEQYILNGQTYEIIAVYTKVERVQSNNIKCASFSMKEIMDQVPELP